MRRYDVGGLGIRVDLMWRNACRGANWVVAEFAGCGPLLTCICH